MEGLERGVGTCKAGALPAELRAHFYNYIILKYFWKLTELIRVTELFQNSSKLHRLQVVALDCFQPARHSKTKRGLILRASDEDAPRTST